jgi:hypothetical protein
VIAKKDDGFDLSKQIEKMKLEYQKEADRNGAGHD